MSASSIALDRPILSRITYSDSLYCSINHSHAIQYLVNTLFDH
jgi:hypothetical protein